jgi:biotin carboxyl carrier protein
VEPGDTVTAETVVGIVETMKLMNPVHAGVAGTVHSIPAANAVMVAAGTALVRIRPA